MRGCRGDEQTYEGLSNYRSGQYPEIVSKHAKQNANIEREHSQGVNVVTLRASHSMKNTIQKLNVGTHVNICVTLESSESMSNTTIQTLNVGTPSESTLLP